MSEGGPTRYVETAREALREYASELFANYAVELAGIMWDIVVLGHTAYDFGWHELTLKPKNGGETIRKRHRYFELWRKNSAGDWKISLVINNAAVREELAGQVGHWFLNQERPENPRGSTGA